MSDGSRARSAHILAGLLVLVIAGVHFQQYVQFMSHVPTVGILFLLNAAGGAALGVALLGPEPALRTLAALGAIGLAVGSLVCLVIALVSDFAGFHEPSLRAAIVVALVAEVLVLPACAAVLAQAWRHRVVAPAQAETVQ